MRVLTLLAILGCVVLAGCGERTSSLSLDDASESTTAYDSFAKQFGEAAMNGNWSAAYAMTTADFQKTTSQADLQKEYDDLVADIKQDAPNFKATTVEVDHGELPSDEKDARDTYELKTIPPKSEWKAWLFALIGDGTPETMQHGLEARMLVISENGQNKIAHVEFGFQD